MPDGWTWFTLIPWIGVAFQVALLFRVRAIQRDVVRQNAQWEGYLPIVAAIARYDDECATYEATKLVIALFIVRMGLPRWRYHVGGDVFAEEETMAPTPS